MDEDIVIPLFRVRWCTRAILEGLSRHYNPRRIYILCPSSEKEKLEALSAKYEIDCLSIVAEEAAFETSFRLSKDEICEVLNLGQSLYNPGWFYQQILKFGAADCIPGLSTNFLVWDSDLLPVATWPVVDAPGSGNPSEWPYYFALLQDSSRGNAKIIDCWENWIREILEVAPATDPESSFVPHHMWFNQDVLHEITSKLSDYYKSEEPWPKLLMRSANEYGTFSEFWLYSSWLKAHHTEKLRYHPYSAYGSTTERFFDDGTGKFSTAFRAFSGRSSTDEPSYKALYSFIESAYEGQPLPSSLSFESSPRHLKKGTDNMHVEELRSKWHTVQDN